MAATPTALPSEFTPRRLARRFAQVALLFAVLALVLVLAPGLDKVRALFGQADPWWIAAAVALEGLSCASYVLMFGPVFCPHMSRRARWELGWSELGAGSLVPASGVGGLALGAWVLHRGGMPADHIARRSIAFFLIKSSVNFVAVAVVGTLLAVGLVGPELPLWLTAVPAALAVAAIAAVLAIPCLGPGADPGADASRIARGSSVVRRAVIGGVGEAVALVRTRNLPVLLGALGYWAFDNAVLWATYHALGGAPALSVVLLGYLIGQLGGLLPIPGGIGGIDGGLIGTLIVFGAPAAATAAAVFAYRTILFWLPLAVGAVAFASLRRGLDRPERPDLCVGVARSG